MIPGIPAQQPVHILQAPVFNTDVVFQSTFSGTNGGTDAIDVSQLLAPMTFVNGAALSNAQATMGQGTSLRLENAVSVAEYVTCPANVLYNLGSGPNFTIECAFRTPDFSLQGAGQIVGVWNEATGHRQWRLVIDSIRIYFQIVQNAQVLQFSFAHNFLANAWYWIAVCRHMGDLRFFSGPTVASTAPMVEKRFSTGAFDVPATALLQIGGSGGKDGCNAFLQMMRLTRDSWYRSDDPVPIPTAAFGTYGPIQPELFDDGEVFHPAQSGQVISASIFDQTIPLPIVSGGPAPVNLGSTGTGTSITQITTPIMSQFVRANGHLLISYILTTDGGKTFSVPAGWTIGDTATGANSSAAWAYHFITDNNNVPACTWSWSGGTNARTKMWNIRSAYLPTPAGLGNKLASFGQSTNLLINGGVGVTSTDAASLAFAIMMNASINQTLPIPSGFTAHGAATGNLDGCEQACYQRMTAAGSVSTGINTTLASSAKWHGFLIEVKKA